MDDNKINELKSLLIKRFEENIQIRENSKYGEFIIQSNKVQSYLIIIILARSNQLNNKLKKYLAGSSLGNLINCFRICSIGKNEKTLINDLEKYNGERNKLAHKMFSDRRLTEEECKNAIRLGENILKKLKR